MDSITTTDFAQFGIRERRMAQELLNAWNDSGLPDDFDDDEVTFMMNRDSGFVFLTNSEYQVAMMNGDKLESFYTCPYCGHEGFKDEMEHEPENSDCTEYLQQIGVIKEPEEDEDLD